MRFNMTVSCEQAAFNLFLHCFLEIIQGYLNLLGFLGRKLDFLRNGFMETNITQQNNTISFILQLDIINTPTSKNLKIFLFA